MTGLQEPEIENRKTPAVGAAIDVMSAIAPTDARIADGTLDRGREMPREREAGRANEMEAGTDVTTEGAGIDETEKESARTAGVGAGVGAGRGSLGGEVLSISTPTLHYPWPAPASEVVRILNMAIQTRNLDPTDHERDHAHQPGTALTQQLAHGRHLANLPQSLLRLRASNPHRKYPLLPPLLIKCRSIRPPRSPLHPSRLKRLKKKTRTLKSRRCAP